MDFDVVIIGAGQACPPLARAFAKAGRRTAVIEREHVGGTCINEGCTPTKTMVASARAAYLAGRGGDYGVRVGQTRVDMERVRERKREIVKMFRTGSEKRLEDAGVELIQGEARFTGERELAVRVKDGGERAVRAELVFINTGCRPAIPDTPGLNDIRWLDSTSIMEVARAPGHLLVVGGGYVGLEFAQMFRRFGSQVTVVQREGQLLSREDSDIAAHVLEILRDDGIAVLLQSEPTAYEARNGSVRIRVRDADGKDQRIEATHVLIAAGRVPNTDRLDPAAGGVETDPRGYVRVNACLETTSPGVYALGDVKGGPAFTHISYDDYRIISTNLLEGGTASTEGRLVPYTVFIDPQLGRIGMTETQARQTGRQVRIARMPMSKVARALEMDESRGILKVVVDSESDRILGVAALGAEGGELASALQIAMMGDLPYTALRDATFAHPTLVESFNNLFFSFDE